MLQFIRSFLCLARDGHATSNGIGVAASILLLFAINFLIIIASVEALADDQSQYYRLLESERIRAEEDRFYFKKQKDQLVGDLLLLTTKNPEAAAHVATVLGSASWAKDPALDKDAKNLLAGIAIVGAISCVLDYDCLSMSNNMVKLSNKADYLQAKINSITNEVGYRLYLQNNCRYPIEFAVTYRDLNDEWQNNSLWTFKANQGAYLTYNGNYIRLRKTILYFYAHTSTNYPPIEWGGEVKLSHSNGVYYGRKVQLDVNDEYDIPLYLSCE